MCVCVYASRYEFHEHGTSRICHASPGILHVCVCVYASGYEFHELRCITYMYACMHVSIKFSELGMNAMNTDALPICIYVCMYQVNENMHHILVYMYACVCMYVSNPEKRQ